MKRTQDPYALRNWAERLATRAKGIFMPEEHAFAALEVNLIAPTLGIAVATMCELRRRDVRCAVTAEGQIARVWCAPRDRMTAQKLLEPHVKRLEQYRRDNPEDSA
jgi:hypothetical protein